MYSFRLRGLLEFYLIYSALKSTVNRRYNAALCVLCSCIFRDANYVLLKIVVFVNIA